MQLYILYLVTRCFTLYIHSSMFKSSSINSREYRIEVHSGPEWKDWKVYYTQKFLHDIIFVALTNQHKIVKIKFQHYLMELGESITTEPDEFILYLHFIWYSVRGHVNWLKYNGKAIGHLSVNALVLAKDACVNAGSRQRVIPTNSGTWMEWERTPLPINNVPQSS